MFKRALSFIIILASVATLSYTLFAKNLFTGLFSGTQSSGYTYAYSVDKRGNVFYIKNGEDSRKYLIGLDTSGRQFCSREISAEIGSASVVDNIYITQDSTLILTSYRFVSGTEYLDGLSIDQFREDGSYVAKIMEKQISKRYDGKCRIVSGLSDDDKKLYFGILDGSSLGVYSVEKAAVTHPQRNSLIKLHDDPSKINAMLALPSGDMVMSLYNGKVMKLNGAGNTENYIFQTGSPVIVTDFWYAGKQFYCRDSVSGDLYASLTGSLNLSCVVRGAKVFSSGEEIMFSKFRRISVGVSGNLMGALDSGSGSRIFVGGLDFLPETANTGNALKNNFALWLLFIAYAAGVVILSLLIWDFFCNVLHMQISLLLRQTLLIFMVVYLSVYIVADFVITPRTAEALTTAFKEQVNRSVQSLGDSIQSALMKADGKNFDDLKVESFFKNFAGQQKTQSALRSSHCYLFSKNAGGFSLYASGEQLESGIPASFIDTSLNLSNEMSKATEEMKTITVSTREGNQLCTMIRLNAGFSGSQAVLCVLSPAGSLQRNIQDIVSTVTLYLKLTGLLLLLLVILVEWITALNLRKLRRGVDKIAAGDYASKIEIRSGDEIEALSKSIMTLSNNILKASNSLRQLNSSYYRFVPQKFLSTIGETRIEHVEKNSQAYKENVVMLFLRFRFLNSPGENSEQIFSNINNVFEKIVPVVNQNGGTVYNFLSDGFNAVFENEADAALRSAFRIREVIDGLNKERGGSLSGDVDVRIFITVGNIMLGFVGDESRMEPTAISQAAQKAEPIGKICFESAVYVACTRDFYERIDHKELRSRRIGEIEVLYEKVELFDLFDSDPYNIIKVKELYADRFELGVNLFSKGDYQNALRMFMEIVKYSSVDGAARNYMVLSESNLHSSAIQRTYTTAENAEKLSGVGH